MKRSEAFAAGLRTYSEDRGCINGHRPAVRYTSTGGCIKCLKRFRMIPTQRVSVPPNELELFKTIMAQFKWVIVNDKGDDIPSSSEPPRIELPPEPIPLPPNTAPNPYGPGGPPRQTFIEHKP